MENTTEGLISVIVPVYNAEKYLERCLSSLTGQSYRNLEILLINDGSTDGSAGICETWSQKDSRIRVLSQKNQGVSAARNLGLDNAAGEYIAFVDADDWIMPKMLEKQIRCLKIEQSDIVLCGFCERKEKETDNSDDFEDSEYSHNIERRQNCANIQATIQATIDARSYAGDYLLRGHNRCWSVLFRQETIGQIRFLPGLTIGEDLLFMIDILPRINRVTILEDQDYCYFINESGAMMAEFREKYMDQITCWELAAERMKQLWPEYLPFIHVCLFQASLLVAGKLALVPDLKTEKIKGYLNRCSEAARESWDVLGAEGRKRLSKGYRAKGLVFLHAPELYLRMYHIWKGMR